MENKPTKEKILKVVSVALPIILIAALAIMLVMAFKLSDKLSSLPVYKDFEENPPPVDSTTSTTEKEEEQPPVEVYYTKGLEYIGVGNGKCELAGIGDASDTYIIVPEVNENGDTVVGIANSAFKNCNTIKGIEFPESIERIGAYAFYGSSVKELEIGEWVNEIGSYAFVACRSLENINVSESNRYYSSLNGVFYNKDKTELIAYPAGKDQNFCVIPKEVEKISNMAFYFCSDIKKVTYYGTQSQWRLIDIGAGNDVIEEALLYCAGSDGK